nr:AraC family transcriptional regulator [Sphingomonas carotinifaciens]
MTALSALVAVALGKAVDEDSELLAARRATARIERIRALIDARLSDPDFTASEVIATSDLSRATLYRTFRPYGGLAGYIQLRRLERVRRALGDPRDERPFATIALDSGFESSSHCSRLFTDRFGVRPGAYRKMMALNTDTDDPRIAMRMWQAEVR